MTAKIWSKVARASLSWRPSIRPVLCRQYAGVATAAASTEKKPEQLDADEPATPMDQTIKPTGKPFHSLEASVSAETLKAITVRPFKLTHMTPVQERVLSLLPQLADRTKEWKKDDSSRDLMVRAKTGTGKTLAFLVPAIEARIRDIELHGNEVLQDSGLLNDQGLRSRAMIRYARENVGTLILSPTRELATQIANEALRLSTHHTGFEVRLFTGGTSKATQLRDWMKGRRDIVVATTGRLRDVLSTEPTVVQSLKQTKTFILDEADTMLDMGFREDIEAIVEYLPEKRQTFLFSATISPSVRQVAKTHLDKDYNFINTVTEEDSPVHAHIPQYSTILPNASHQIPHLLKLLAQAQLSSPAGSKTIVFFPTTRMTQLFCTIVRELQSSVLPAGQATRVYELHSRRDQNARAKTSDMFRYDRDCHSVLITSDVSARGVDYPGVTRVIQVGIPASTDQYIHRVGRTGRAGSSGRGDLILLDWEIGFLTWQLTEVPIKSATINEVDAEVKELAKLYDTDQPAYNELTGWQPSKPKFDRRGKPSDTVPFRGSVSEGLEQINTSVQSFLQRLDEEALRETFLSLLGYYISKSPELRVPRTVILEGLKNWSTAGMGLPVPPNVSEAFLEKLGFHDGRTKHFGSRPRIEKDRHREAHWLGRGAHKTRDRARPTKDYGEFSDTERQLNPFDYKTPRYDTTRAPWKKTINSLEKATDIWGEEDTRFLTYSFRK